MLKEIEERYSCRKYTDQAVEKEKIDEVIKAGLAAPSGMNTQYGIVIAVTDKKTRDKLSVLNAEVMGEKGDPFYGAPVVLIVAVKKYRNSKYDGAAMITSMAIEATHQGLGSCWINRAKEELESEEGKALLKKTGLDFEEYEGIGHLILGYADMEKPQKKIRENRVYYIG